MVELESSYATCGLRRSLKRSLQFFAHTLETVDDTFNVLRRADKVGRAVAW
jgi:hypothetical protein